MKPRTKNENYVDINSESLFKIADKTSLNRLVVAMGYSDNYIYSVVKSGRVSRDILERICKFYGKNPADVIATSKKSKSDSDDAVLELLAEQSERLDRRIEESRMKADRDIAGIRKIITSLQVQIEAIRNERKAL